MMKKTAALAVLGGSMLMVATSVIPASAVNCQGAYQYNSAAGGYIASSYCEDNLVATVARSHGMKWSNVAVRQNPNIKAEACRFAGSDIRISDICVGHMPEDDSSGRR